MNVRRGLAAGLALIALAACRAPLPSDRVRSEDHGVPIALGDLRAQRSIAQVRADQTARSAMRAAARVSIDAPGLVLSRPQRIVVERPDRLRIEVLALFDQVAGVVATDGVQYGYVDLASGTRDAGPVDDGLLWRTARIALSPADAVALLLGSPRLRPEDELIAAYVLPDGSVLLETREEPGGPVRSFTLDPAGRMVRARLRAADGGTVWAARFEDWREAPQQPFAHRVDLVFPGVGASVRVAFHAVEFEPTLAPGLFVLHVAPGG